MAPNRTSLPSRLPPGAPSEVVWSTQIALRAPLAPDSNHAATPTEPSHNTAITARIT